MSMMMRVMMKGLGAPWFCISHSPPLLRWLLHWASHSAPGQRQRWLLCTACGPCLACTPHRESNTNGMNRFDSRPSQNSKPCDKLSVHDVDMQYTASVLHVCMFDSLPVPCIKKQNAFTCRASRLWIGCCGLPEFRWTGSTFPLKAV